MQKVFFCTFRGKRCPAGKEEYLKKYYQGFKKLYFCHWQDWMLEDEVVTEEKQEVELYKNDMAKEMTKEQVFEFLKDTKILCTSKAETIQVQVKLFQFGIEWISKIKGICEDKYLLFITLARNY